MASEMTRDAMHVRLREMSLGALREYRRQLREEEDRVSYWRRLMQARLDMVAARRLKGSALTPQQIAAALGDGVRQQHRLALVALEVGEPLPDLPELARLWATPVGGNGDEPDGAAVRELADAEAQLSTYRSTLHRLLDAATAELIRRYQADPLACLDVLPVEPPRLAANA